MGKKKTLAWLAIVYRPVNYFSSTDSVVQPSCAEFLDLWSCFFRNFNLKGWQSRYDLVEVVKDGQALKIPGVKPAFYRFSVALLEVGSFSNLVLPDIV